MNPEDIGNGLTSPERFLFVPDPADRMYPVFEALATERIEKRHLKKALEEILAVRNPLKIIPVINFYDCEECEKKDKIASAALLAADEKGENNDS
jgi:hypothetical protein